MAVAFVGSDINIPAIDVKFGTLPKYFDFLYISAEQGMFR
jgi:uncharacterized membrane protein